MSLRLTLHIISVLLLLNLFGAANGEVEIELSTHDVLILKDHHKEFSIRLNGSNFTDFDLIFRVQHDNVVQVSPAVIAVKSNALPLNRTVSLSGLSPGHVEITAETSPADAVNVSDVFIRVVVAISSTLILISAIIGWCYFIAWSVSFYPQIYANCKRQSVVGLNFDFLALNALGFLLYAIFNIGLYFVPFIQDEYHRRNPRGVNPVLLNDVFFAVHALAVTLFTIGQCSVFERAEQKVSLAARSIISFFILCIATLGALSTFDVFHWLDFLQYCSYIKLTITLIKYVPQAFMNYRRKSTVGWSIGNVLLDFTGGWLSMLQMFINAYNYDDWYSLFGDATKFGLGLFSVMFDVLFLVQHYVLYRNMEPYAEVPGNNAEVPTENSPESEPVEA